MGKQHLSFAYNQDIDSQVSYLLQVLRRSKIIQTILDRAQELNLPNWYLGAGCISQTIWNYSHGYELTKNIKDADLVYFDDKDITAEGQDKYIKMGEELFTDLPLEVEIVNEARVHLWYGNQFGKPIRPYKSTEDAINTWPTTATCVGIRKTDGKTAVYAPYGLNDLLSMIVRPNKGLITKEIYLSKARRWKSA